jgi:F-type H+-transporting ATPase subunit delta
MKTTRQQQREARRLFQVCVVDGALDEARVRRVVGRVLDTRGTDRLKVLSRFQRFVRLHRAAHSVRVESATPLPADVRTRIESGLSHAYGPGFVITYGEKADLLGGVRVTAGSDVYDGSLRGRLEALGERFEGRV